MKNKRPSSVELEEVLALENINNGLGVAHDDRKVVNVNANVFVNIVISPHSNVRFSFAGQKTFGLEAIRESFGPTFFTETEAIKCLIDNKDVAFALAKFWSSLDMHFLASDAFEAGVTNVGGPTRQVVEFCEKENSADVTKGNNARVYTLERDLSEMTASHCGPMSS